MNMSMETRYGLIIFVALLLWLFGFSIIVVLDAYTERKRKKFFAVLIAVMVSLVVQNYSEYSIIRYMPVPVLRLIVVSYRFIIIPVLLVMFAYLISPYGKKIIAWCLVGINTIVYIISAFTHICFYIDESNQYIGGPLQYFCLVVNSILLVYLIYLSVSRFKFSRLKEFIFHTFWIVVIVLAVIGDAFLNNKQQWVDSVTIAAVGASAFTYIWIHQKIVHEQQTNFIAEQRIRVIRSQVQPHFIYNTLSSIRNIEGNPEETKRAITEFAGYIRGNLAALDVKEVIPFKKEIEYVKDYIALQQRRFPDKINVTYDIADEDFSLPPLTLQILVENSIKHGITTRYESGNIAIKTYCEKKYHVISIVDDGVGFDTEILKTTDRVGLRAVKNRLEYYQDGLMDIKSAPGKGTSVTIKIPKHLSNPEEEEETLSNRIRRKLFNKNKKDE